MKEPFVLTAVLLKVEGDSKLLGRGGAQCGPLTLMGPQKSRPTYVQGLHTVRLSSLSLAMR